jgi:serine/threonine-protein kinase
LPEVPDWPYGVAVDISGNVYVADTGNNRIRKITPIGNVTTLAGSGGRGYADGQGTAAIFHSPFGDLAVDGSGNVYVADTNNNRIRKITPSGDVTTLAGSGRNSFNGDTAVIEGSSYADGQGTAASFASPSGVAVDGGGNVYVADTGNHRIRKITPGGNVTTLAGSGSIGHFDGQGSEASFYEPTGVAVDESRNVYVADKGNARIRKITPSGNVTTLAGSGSRGYGEGQGTAASFAYPYGVAVDGVGNVYVADNGNQRIRKITPSGNVTTLAGSGSFGSTDGPGTSASFSNSTGVAVDGSGNVYVADMFNQRIRKILFDSDGDGLTDGGESMPLSGSFTGSSDSGGRASPGGGGAPSGGSPAQVQKLKKGGKGKSSAKKSSGGSSKKSGGKKSKKK